MVPPLTLRQPADQRGLLDLVKLINCPLLSKRRDSSSAPLKYGNLLRNLSPSCQIPINAETVPRGTGPTLSGFPDKPGLDEDSAIMAHMRGTLLLALLSVKSSYSQGIETALENADDVPDTLQWWFGDGGCWRVRTYALDHDIHAYQVANSLQTTLELAKKNNHGNYGDIIKNQHQIHFVDCSNATEIEAEFGQIGLAQ